ncbi:MAG TPA: SAM-dependent chlorinase/fluorinase, partial [Kofleriaceae bacterium]|nr:SAM-dependent chlorinase/fluorinase [Kofleriaceae bacterium]
MIITLTTDFGARDGFVGAMKGVIARLTPEARVVDVAHDIPRHDIAHGAWVLATAAGEFPSGTIHVAVVDPGVGSARLEVIVAAGGQLFVGPDNGLFQHVAAWGVEGTWAITSPAPRTAPDLTWPSWTQKPSTTPRRSTMKSPPIRSRWRWPVIGG